MTGSRMPNNKLENGKKGIPETQKASDDGGKRTEQGSQRKNEKKGKKGAQKREKRDEGKTPCRRSEPQEDGRDRPEGAAASDSEGEGAGQGVAKYRLENDAGT